MSVPKRIASERSVSVGVAWEHLDLVKQALRDFMAMKEVGDAIEILRSARVRNSAVWIFGNGGSAATASHFANDLVKMARVRAFAVTDQTATIMAFGNDHGWNNMFRDYLERVLLPGDVLVAISCSGASSNVLSAIPKGADRVARQISVIALSGRPGPKNELAGGWQDGVSICVDADDIKVQEDVHMAICHAIAGALA